MLSRSFVLTAIAWMRLRRGAPSACSICSEEIIGKRWIDSRRRSPSTVRLVQFRTRSTSAAISPSCTPRWGICRERSFSSAERRTAGAPTGRVGAEQSGDLALAHADLAMRFNTYPEAERQYLRAENSSARRRGRGQAETEGGLGQLLAAALGFSGRADPNSARPAHGRGARRSTRVALTRLQLGASRRNGTTTARAQIAGAAIRAAHPGRCGGRSGCIGTLGTLAARRIDRSRPSRCIGSALARLGVASRRDLVASALHGLLGERAPQPRRSRRGGAGAAPPSREVERMSSVGPTESAELRSGRQVEKCTPSSHTSRSRAANTAAGFAASERCARASCSILLARDASRSRKARADDTLAVARTRSASPDRRAHRRAREAPAVGRVRGPLATEACRSPYARRSDRRSDSTRDLLLQLRERARNTAAMFRGDRSARKEMVAAPSEQALLEYLVGDSSSLVFVVTSDTVGGDQLNVARHELGETRGLQPRHTARP